MPYKINVGQKLPAFTVKDNEGYDLTDQDLIGSPVVLYFYPKDDTPGCTKEACSFRDHMDNLDSLDTLVIGVSPDSSESHEAFSTKYELNYTLIPDQDKILCKKFDVLRPNEKGEMKVERTTFVIDSEGIIRWIERPVEVNEHIKRVINAVESLEVV